MKNALPILRDARERLMAVHYTDNEIERICALLKRFCDTAAIYTLELFIRAKIYEDPIPFQTVFVVLALYDHIAFRFSSADRYGDTDDTSCDISGRCIGMENAKAFFRVYQAINLPCKGLY